MKPEDFKDVFDAHPTAEVIHVVDGMPFLEQGHAASHVRTTGKPMVSIRRSEISGVKVVPAKAKTKKELAAELEALAEAEKAEAAAASAAAAEAAAAEAEADEPEA